MQRTILVTGGAGFIGSRLVGRLLEEGHIVAALDNLDPFYDPNEKRANLAPYMSHPAFTFIDADIRDRDAGRSIFARHTFDVVVHLAALAGVRPSLQDPVRYADVNVTGTTNLLELCREFGVPQFVFGSSSSVYGEQSDAPFSEDAVIARPISPYAATKAAGEVMCHAFTHLYGIRCICLRFFTVYGPGQRPDLAIRKFAERIMAGEPIQLFGDGSTSRDYTYVDDIVAGITAAIAYDATPYEIINLGGSRTTTLARLVELLEEQLGKKAVIERLPGQPGDVPITYANVAKAKRLLGYEPQTSIEDGITQFVAWLRSRQK